MDQQGFGPAGNGPETLPAQEIVLTAENNPVAAEQLVEQRRANEIMEERFERLEERLVAAVNVAVAASNVDQRVGDAIISALNRVVDETRRTGDLVSARTASIKK